MFLTQTAEYALRAMTAVRRLSVEGPVTSGDIGECTRIPKPYLSKLLRRLVVHELLIAKRGRGGGFLLARPSEEISFHDILSAVDSVPGQSLCAFGWGECRADAPCPLHEAYSEVTAAFDRWARDTGLDSVEIERLAGRSID